MIGRGGDIAGAAAAQPATTVNIPMAAVQAPVLDAEQAHAQGRATWSADEDGVIGQGYERKNGDQDRAEQAETEHAEHREGRHGHQNQDADDHKIDHIGGNAADRDAVEQFRIEHRIKRVRPRLPTVRTWVVR